MEDKSAICSHCENEVGVGSKNNMSDRAAVLAGGSSSCLDTNTNPCTGACSGNAGSTIVFSTCRRWMVSGRFQDILPKESLTMSLVDWEDLYRRERLAQVHHSVYTNSGCFLQLDQRQLVMSWISDVAHRLAWEKSTFHIATSLIDQYMFCLERDPVSRRRLDRSSLAATFAAAVVTAASLGECLGECHDRKHCPGLPPLHRFVQSSGIIRSSKDIVEMQIQLLVQTSRYGGPSLLNKTPAHMTLHYLSRLKHLVESLLSSLPDSASPSGAGGAGGATNGPCTSQKQRALEECGSAVRHHAPARRSCGAGLPSEQQPRHCGVGCAGHNLSSSPLGKKGGGGSSCWVKKIGIGTTVGQAILGIRDRIDYACLFERIMFAHELALYSGINLLIPGSRISASMLINILISYDPILQLPSHQNILYNCLCLLDYDTGIRPYMPYLDPLIRRIVSMSIETIQAMESNGAPNAVGSGVNKGGGGNSVYKLFSQSTSVPCDESTSGVILIHKHHVIPEKFLNGLRISTLIAMHSRMNQPNMINPFSISSPNSIPVSPHSSFGSVSGSSPGSFQCSPIFYSFSGGISAAPGGGQRYCLDEKHSFPHTGCYLVKNSGVGKMGGGQGHILYETQFQSSGCSLDDGNAKNNGFLANDGAELTKVHYDHNELIRDDLGLKLYHKSGHDSHQHHQGHGVNNDNTNIAHTRAAFSSYFGHLHLNNRGSSDDYQHLYTTCSTATNSPLLGGTHF